MTAKQIFDVVLLEFPTVMESAFLAMLNSAQSSFVTETECMVTQVSLTLDSTTNTYDLPTDFDVLKSVTIEDDERCEVIGVAYEIDRSASPVHLILYDIDDPTATALPDDIDRVTVKYLQAPTAITTLTATPTVPERFHLALALLIKLTLGGDPVRFGQNKAMYDSLRLQAKRYGNTYNDKSPTTIHTTALAPSA